MSCCRSPCCWPRDRISGSSLFTAKLNVRELFDPSTLTTCPRNNLACCQEPPRSAEPICQPVPSVQSSQPGTAGQEHWKSVGATDKSDCWLKLFFQYRILQYNHHWQRSCVFLESTSKNHQLPEFWLPTFWEALLPLMSRNRNKPRKAGWILENPHCKSKLHNGNIHVEAARTPP